MYFSLYIFITPLYLPTNLVNLVYNLMPPVYVADFGHEHAKIQYILKIGQKVPNRTLISSSNFSTSALCIQSVTKTVKLNLFSELSLQVTDSFNNYLSLASLRPGSEAKIYFEAKPLDTSFAATHSNLS